MSKRRIILSVAVVGVAGDDRGGPEQLFGQHRPDQQVRPGRLAERQQKIGALEGRRIVAVGRADQEARFALARCRASPASSFANSVEDRSRPFSSSTTRAKSRSSAGILPPVSGSSVSRIGQAMRLT